MITTAAKPRQIHADSRSIMRTKYQHETTTIDQDASMLILIVRTCQENLCPTMTAMPGSVSHSLNLDGTEDETEIGVVHLSAIAGQVPPHNHTTLLAEALILDRMR